MTDVENRAEPELETGYWPEPRLVPDPVVAKILVADDDPRNLLAMQEMLRAPGYEVVTARSGEEALRQVLREDFAVILLDVQMPRIDGYEVAAMIRGRPRSSRVPIIFLTAFNKDELHVFRGYTAGAVDYVFKPIEPIVLKSKVDVFVDLYRKTEEIRRQAEQERRLLLENLRVRNEKLQAEQALRRREEHQSLVVRALPIALYTAAATEAHRRLRFTSESVEQITGFAPERFLSEEGFWASRLHEEDRDRVLAELGSVYETGSITLEYRWRYADGGERHILDQAVLIRDDDGSPREIFGLWLDITERKQMEQNLLHASKLEALGRLTGGIAHDFNNMLSVVIGSLDLLEKSLAGNDKASRRARMALEGALRCADLTNRLLAFSRRQPLQASVVDLLELVPGMLELLRRTLGESIDVQLETEDGLWPILVDRSQFEAVLVNLAVNARDAMPEGGRLTIKMKNRDLDGGDPQGAELPGPSVEISVIDTGTGMPPEVLNRAFEPFFTTKEVGKGTGLGLSMTYGFVKQSGGHVEINSRPGDGTTVRMLLPRAAHVDASPQAPAADQTVEPPRGHGEAILVVEDDADVRRVTVSTLEALGYQVAEAENGQAAIKILGGTAGIKLVFSDVNMPGGMTGVQLAREIRQREPNVRILLTSGHLSTDPDADGLDVLLKPYRADELAQRVRRLLDQTTADSPIPLAISA